MVLDTEAELAACESEWRELHRKCNRADPFGEWEYVWAWWRAFGKPGKREGQHNPLFILKIFSPSNELVAIFPLLTSRINRSPLSPFVLRLFGHNGVLIPGDMSEMPLYLVLNGWEHEATRALIEAVRAKLRARACDSVHIRLSYDGCDRYFELEVPATVRLASVVAKPRTGDMIATLGETYKAYIKGLSKSMRDNTKYYPKLLERAGHSWTVRTVWSPDEMRAAVDTVIRLHRERAKSPLGRRHDDHLPELAHADFLQKLMLRKAADGQAFVSILEIDRQTVAAQAFFAYGDKISVYYSGFDPAWFKFSLITVLQGKVFEESIESGYRRVDFVLEDAPWKARWGAIQQTPSVEVFLCSKAPVSFVKTGLWALARAIRRAGESLEKNRRTFSAWLRRVSSRRSIPA